MDLGNYLNNLKARKSDSPARNYMEETAWKYVPELNWQDNTFFNDYRFFWLACNTFYKKHTHAEFEKILQWAAGVHAHPRGIANLLRKA